MSFLKRMEEMMVKTYVEKSGGQHTSAVYCPNCGDEMSEWTTKIYECKDCDTMVDVSVYEEENNG